MERIRITEDDDMIHGLLGELVEVDGGGRDSRSASS